jgi:hypothetical protein
METITLRGGDFNMDGYPDLIVTLIKTSGNKQTQTFLLENVPCVSRTCGLLTRTFSVKWKALMPFTNGTVMGSFYDFYQDGILDVVLVEKKDDKYRPLAFRNTLDYDANFVKVIVLTGLTNKFSPSKKTPLGRNIKRWGELVIETESNLIFVTITFFISRNQPSRTFYQIRNDNPRGSRTTRCIHAATTIRLLLFAPTLHHFWTRANAQFCRLPHSGPCQSLQNMDPTDSQLTNDSYSQTHPRTRPVESPALCNTKQIDFEKCVCTERHLFVHFNYYFSVIC